MDPITLALAALIVEVLTLGAAHEVILGSLAGGGRSVASGSRRRGAARRARLKRTRRGRAWLVMRDAALGIPVDFARGCAQGAHETWPQAKGRVRSRASRAGRLVGRLWQEEQARVSSDGVPEPTEEHEEGHMTSKTWPGRPGAACRICHPKGARKQDDKPVPGESTPAPTPAAPAVGTTTDGSIDVATEVLNGPAVVEFWAHLAQEAAQWVEGEQSAALHVGGGEDVADVLRAHAAKVAAEFNPAEEALSGSTVEAAKVFQRA